MEDPRSRDYRLDYDEFSILIDRDGTFVASLSIMRDLKREPKNRRDY